MILVGLLTISSFYQQMYSTNQSMIRVRSLKKLLVDK